MYIVVGSWNQITYGPVFVLWFSLDLLATASPSRCTKICLVLASVSELSWASGCQHTLNTPGFEALGGVLGSQSSPPEFTFFSGRGKVMRTIFTLQSCFLLRSFPGLTKILYSENCLPKIDGRSESAFTDVCQDPIMQKEVSNWSHFARSLPVGEKKKKKNNRCQ